MKMTKRILALILAVFMVVSLAACGGESDNKGDWDGDTDYLATVNDAQVKLFGDLKGTKLRVADDVVLAKWEEDFYKQLELSTGMTVEIEPMGSNELMTKVAQAVASGDTRNYFDVCDIVNSTILNAVYGNLIIPMDRYVYYDDPVWKYSDAADFNCLDLFKLDDHFYGAPSHGYHETFIYYNKTYFEEMQVPDPYTEYYLKDNWTFETFMDVCEKVTKKAADGTVEVAAWATWNYFSFAAAAGNSIIQQKDNGKWEVIFDQPNGMAGLNVLYECAKNGWLDTATSGYEEFVNRKIAMIMEKPSSAMGTTEAYSRMSDEIGMVPYPKMNKEQEKYIAPMSCSGYAITSCAQNPAGAAAYIYYHRVGEQERDKSEAGQKNLLRFCDEEATQRRNEYIAKCDFSMYMIDGLTGWYSENRKLFLNKIFKDQQNPATVVDSLRPLIADSLRKTVG